MAIYNASLLARENSDLRSAIENDRQKKSRSKRQMASTEGLSFQEARDLISLRSKEIEARGGDASGGAPQSLGVPERAPPTCSECNIQGRKRTSCPTRFGI